MYDRFLELLNEKGVKVSDVSKATGIRQGVFSDWKSGRYKPKHDKMMLIAAYFCVAVEYLEGISDEKIPQKPQWQDYKDFINEQTTYERERLTDFMHRMRSYYDAMNIDGQEHILQTCEDMMQVGRFRK